MIQPWSVFILFFITPLFSFLVPFDIKDPIESHKLCGQCQHVFLENNQTMSCRLFGKLNLLTGQVYYQSCTATRQNTSQCGLDGKLYFHRIPFAEFGKK